MSNTTRRRGAATSVSALFSAVLAVQTTPAIAADPPGFLGHHFVYTQTNDTKKAVVDFRRDQFGNLTPVPGLPFSTPPYGLICHSRESGNPGT